MQNRKLDVYLSVLGVKEMVSLGTVEETEHGVALGLDDALNALNTMKAQPNSIKGGEAFVKMILVPHVEPKGMTLADVFALEDPYGLSAGGRKAAERIRRVLLEGGVRGISASVFVTPPDHSYAVLGVNLEETSVREFFRESGLSASPKQLKMESELEKMGAEAVRRGELLAEIYFK